MTETKDIDAALVERVAKKIDVWHLSILHDNVKGLLSNDHFKFAVCEWVFTHPDFITAYKYEHMGVFGFAVRLKDEQDQKYFTDDEAGDWLTCILLAADVLPETHD